MNNQTIRIKKTKDGNWVTVQLLSVAFGWIEVADGNESLWVTVNQVHPRDRKHLAAGVAWSRPRGSGGTRLNRSQVEQIINSAQRKNEKPDLRGVDLSLADLHRLDLRLADLRGVDLSEAILIAANLVGARLKGTNLSEADLRGANLTGADLRFANLSGAEYDANTTWPVGFDPVRAGAIRD